MDDGAFERFRAMTEGRTTPQDERPPVWTVPDEQMRALLIFAKAGRKAA